MTFNERQRQVQFMCIDDNPVNIFLVEALLKSHRFTTKPIGLTSGKDALMYFNKIGEATSLPGIILLDLYMPGMTGLQFLDTLAKVHRDYSLKIPVIILSSSVNPEDIQKTLRCKSVKLYIEKPLTTAKLEQIFTTLGIV